MSTAKSHIKVIIQKLLLLWQLGSLGGVLLHILNDIIIHIGLGPGEIIYGDKGILTSQVALT